MDGLDRVDGHRRAVELRPNSRVALYAVLLLCLLSCVGQGIAYFNPDSYDQFNVGVFFVIITSGVAGMVSSLAGYPLSRQIDSAVSGKTVSQAQIDLEKRGLSRGLKFCAAGAAIEVAIGEFLAVLAFVTGATNDGTVFFSAVFIAVLGGGTCLLLGWVAGLLVLWPILALLGMLRQKVAGKPVNETVGAVSVMSLTLIAFAITGVLGIGSAGDDIVGTPRGRGLAEILIVLIRYSGSPTEQALSWVARALLVGLVLEIFWLRHISRLRRQADALAAPLSR